LNQDLTSSLPNMSNSPSSSQSVHPSRTNTGTTISTAGADYSSSTLTSPPSAIPVTPSTLSVHTAHSDLTPASLPVRPILRDRAFSSATVIPADVGARPTPSPSPYPAASPTSGRARAATVTTSGNAPRRSVHRPCGIETRASKLMRVVSEVAARPNVDREWTVFSQRMENEGQLAPSASAGAGAGAMSLRRTGGRSLRQQISRQSMRSAATGPPTDMFPEIDDFASPQEVGQNPFESAFQVGETTGSSSEESLGNYDSDSSDDEDSGSTHSQTSDSGTSSRSRWKLPELPTIPVLWRNILKCAVAYFIASLFTFSPYLSRWITDVTSSGEKRPSPSGHMVATV
jgi:hypothetical protein